ncbi:MAG: MopE-related protein, partial [Myxococcota bacterium]|nr:MopE-related protein [Myxococcota bacterium]
LTDQSGETITVTGSLTVAAGGYVVLGARTNQAQNGGAAVDYQYNRNNFRLNRADAIILQNSSGTVLDTVVYKTNSTHPAAAGTSLNLGSLSSDNAVASNWCEASSPFGNGDLGTPGSANDSCGGLADLSAGDLVISEVFPSPTTVWQFRGEWFEVYNNTSGSVNLNGLEINGSAADGGDTVSSDIYVAPGGYALFAARLNSTDNGGMTNVDYQYNRNNMQLNDNGDVMSISFNGTTFDSVSYITVDAGGSFPSSVGKAFNLSSTTLDATSNDNASNWCSSTTTFGNGDFGTPGAANETCSGADADGDGFTTADGDCDDTNADAFPGNTATELCDGVDNNCSGDETDADDATTFYEDADGDAFGNANSTTASCESSVIGYVTDNTDCDDTRSISNPTANEICDNLDNDCDSLTDEEPTDGATYYLDADGDGYGDDNNSLAACSDPSDASNTYVGAAGDCNDDPAQGGASVNPGVTEPCSATEDLNCDGVFGSDTDNDGDGFTTCDATNPDCNDADDTINPGAQEACDDIDNDCNGVVDDNATDASTWYADTDGDGYGDENSSQLSCDNISEHVSNDDDCDDNDDAINPSATETCDTTADDDCDGDSNDQGATNGTTFFTDADADGFGDANSTAVFCTLPASGYSSDSSDCDDSTGLVNPTATEICDSIDNDCDSLIDGADDNVDASTTGTTYYRDADNDLFGDDTDSQVACTQPSGYIGNNLDFNDNDRFIKPGADEVCDNQDNDCDSLVDSDDDSLTDGTTFFADTDADTYGDASNTTVSCSTSPPANFVSNSNDCDDSSAVAAATFPGAAENESATVCMTDSDADGYGDSSASGSVTAGTDCNDSDDAINPDATEIAGDNTDQNCDNQELCFIDGDGDTFGISSTGTSSTIDCTESGFSINQTDCDDAVSTTFPGAAENESSTVCMSDADGDGYGDSSASGSVTAGTDCNDNASTGANTFPGAAPNDSSTECMTDEDGDDYGESNPANGVSAGTDCDDTDNSVTASDTAYYVDADGDGFGDINDTGTTSCTQPTGSVTDNTDCDDDASTGTNTFPGAAESETNSTACMRDNDGDGFGDASAASPITAGTDCDDTDGSVTAGTTYYADSDGDGFGDQDDNGSVACTQPNDALTDNSDFNDNDDSVNPDATETCNDGVDSDCVEGDNGPVCDGGVASADTTITGESGGDVFGFTLTHAGDTDNDGTFEYAIGARGNNSLAGAAYVFEGNVGSSIDASSASAKMTGSAGEVFGCDVGGGLSVNDLNITADVNNDGNDDLIVGALRNDDNGNTAGAVYVFYGPMTNETSSDADFIILGENAGDLLGRSVTMLGDVSGDNISDFLISAHKNDFKQSDSGRAYLFYGTNLNGGLAEKNDTYSDDVTRTMTMNSTSEVFADVYFDTYFNNSRLGADLAPAGDLSGDGVNDILMGADLYDRANVGLNCGSGSCFDEGAALVWAGGSSNLSTHRQFDFDSNGSLSARAILVGEDGLDHAGEAVYGVGDVNGDGTNDMLIGAVDAGVGGKAYLVSGAATGVVDLGSSSHVIATLIGESGEDFARSVGALGDINGDGDNDIIIGAKSADSNGSDSGSAYIFLGDASLSGTLSSSTANSVFAGATAGDEIGTAASTVGDINGNGSPDILVGGHHYSTGGTNRGAAYIIFGESF